MTYERGEFSWELDLYTNCPIDVYPEMNFNGIVEGFQYTKTVHWDYYDVAGFIGYIDSRKTIHIVMRGTTSKANRDMNSDDKLIDYATWPECNCRVRRGVDTGVNGVYP
jgi:hypothetical protein